MQTDELFKTYLILYTLYTFDIVMPSMPGPNGVKEETMPYRPDSPPIRISNPCRHPAYHILPNTFLVYQFIYIKHQEHQFNHILGV